MRAAAACGRTLIALALVAAPACKEKQRTEIVLGLATDLDAPAPLASVHLTVYRLPQGIPIGEVTEWPLSGNLGERYSLPGTFAVFSDSGTADRVRVRLTAFDNSSPVPAKLIVRTAVLSLVPERTLFVRLGLVSACLGKTDCDEGQTCVEGRCVSEEIDTSRLPTYVSGEESYLTCAGGTTFIDTSSKKPLLMKSGQPPCSSGLCAEGVCLTPPTPGAGGAAGAGGGGGAGGGAGLGGVGGGVALGPPPQLTSLSPTQATAGTQ